MRTVLFCLALLALAAFNSGCKSKKVVSELPPLPDASMALWNTAAGNAIEWQTVSIRSRLQYRDASDSQSGNVNIRMVRDSAIWMNVTKLGFEVARALITTDSAFLINRFESGMTAMSLAALSSEYGIPPRLDYIQSLLMGQVVPGHFTHQNLRPANPQGFEVQDQRLLWHYAIQAETGVPGSIKIEDEGSFYSLAWNMSNFRPLANDKPFSFLRNGIVYEQDQIVLQIQMDVSNVDINAVFDMPFNRPR